MIVLNSKRYSNKFKAVLFLKLYQKMSDLEAVKTEVDEKWTLRTPFELWQLIHRAVKIQVFKHSGHDKIIFPQHWVKNIDRNVDNILGCIRAVAENRFDREESFGPVPFVQSQSHFVEENPVMVSEFWAESNHDENSKTEEEQAEERKVEEEEKREKEAVSRRETLIENEYFGIKENQCNERREEVKEEIVP